MATRAGTQHEMVLVPAGEFPMGDSTGGDNERPVHTVHLDDFYIDRFEVTTTNYLAFLEATGGNPRWAGNYRQFELTADGFALSSVEEANHPAVDVTWFGAAAYCVWAELRLPTEAEWEKAARGTDGRTYPWGEGLDDTRARFESNELTDVGSFPEGTSPYGVHDMAGNAWEWVADWFHLEYYEESPRENPEGPLVGVAKVLRGGGWGEDAYLLRSTFRLRILPDESFGFGFRCARDGR